MVLQEEAKAMTDHLARVARAAWVEYIQENASNPPAKWLTQFDELSPFWQGLNRHIARRVTEAIVEEPSEINPSELIP